ncbi:hypothetical protein IFM51744_08151 [Aspergillus udagawae]|uniref:Uncharacterized protein n=1 Tax=Aspergillus udagawae TaxID=91492 RepID=A0A8H3S5E9_9EURO|nr:hypothetical protein IFM46972_08097 [Aspergillus udagawae]GFF53618.1 hypothetical protein IFM51744_08151 [Aspergillus udagawae]GFF95033.1 hypothetical protein IFM53868_07816 [Aspergillus udagawae]GFG17097.1 hypothetical protein IFM5058_08297 [Aspergillus udagawae]
MSSKLGKYEPIEEGREDTTASKYPITQPTPTLIWIVFGASIALCAAAIAFLAVEIQWHSVTPYTQSLYPQSKSQKYTCGNSTEEAKQRGCTFDILSMNWLPEQCPRDETQEFIDYSANETWVYYRDRHAEHPIKSTDELSELGDKFWWSTQREHLVHCAFMILRLHKVLERGGKIDHLTGSFGHTKHCVMMLLDASKADPENDRVNTPGNIALGSC